MKGLGRLSYFLCLKVVSNSSIYYLFQVKYATNILSQVGLTDNKICTTPIETTSKFDDKDGTHFPNLTLYWQLVGNFTYLTIIGPNITNAIHIVNRFMTAP